MTKNISAEIETLRTSVHLQIDVLFDDAIAQLSSAKLPKNTTFKCPTPADGHDPRNKNGLNLTPRGVEILYRVFDDGGGYNRASKMLNISQGAAKNRKALWTKDGGMQREKVLLDIDTNR